MGGLKVWWVLASDQYYPGLDNFIESFETQEEALDFEEENKNDYDLIRVVNIAGRLYFNNEAV